MTARTKKNKFVARTERERRQSRWILIGTIIAGAAVVILVAYGLIYEYLVKPHKPVIVVNGDKITTESFRAEYLLRFQEDSDPQVLASSVVNTLINQLLTVQEAKARGYIVTEDDIDQTIYGYFGFYPDGTPTPFPTRTPDPDADSDLSDDTDLAEAVPAATPTAFTRDMFDENYSFFLEQWKTQGVEEKEIRASIERGLYLEKMLDEFRVDVPKAEDQVWARHILVETEDEALSILEKLDEGESWEALASEFSIDSSNAEFGGDLGWFVRDRMVPEFSDAAFSMGIGDISDPVQTAFGWHIIEVLGHQEQVLDPYTFETRVQTAYQEWLNTKLEDAQIEIDQDLVNDIVSSIFPGFFQ